jgi:hypothetical protein
MLIGVPIGGKIETIVGVVFFVAVSLLRGETKFIEISSFFS